MILAKRCGFLTPVAAVAGMVATLVLGPAPAATAQGPTVELDRDDEAGRLTVRIDGEEAVTYQYGDEYAIPHYWPVRSPSDKRLTVQHPAPYPHHRSLWIADKVQLESREPVDFYHVHTNYVDPNNPDSGYRHFITHREFTELEAEGNTATIGSRAQWLLDGETAAIEEHRTLRITALGDGEYLMDLSWKLTAADGDVRFVSDWVHYGWPFIRMHPQFSGERGGTILADDGATGQEQTNGEFARWIDYSNTVDGRTEGLAVFVHPDGGTERPRWLTREYGTFGPRRAEDFSGTDFKLRQGESIGGRVGIYVHRGNADKAQVQRRYERYVEEQE